MISAGGNMGLQFIFGNAGAGKSHYLYESVIEESMQVPDKNFIVLVPEQFTMQTQKDFCMMHPRHGIMNIDVLSFGRLAHRIFEEFGGTKKIVLDDEGKNLILRKIAGKYENDFTVLKGNLKKQGYISEIKSVISEFTQYGIGFEELDQFLHKLDTKSNLYYKLKDIQKVYEGFETYLADRYITNEEILELLCEFVPNSEILKDSTVVLDGFTGFTPVQVKLLGELMQVCKKVMVTVLMDEKEDPYLYQHPYQLFALSKQMVSSLVKCANAHRVEIEEERKLYSRPSRRFQNNEPLDFLESQLFRPTRKQYEKEQDSIEIHVARNPKAEAEYVAGQIRRLVREKGYHYREIAIIASDLGVYEDWVEKALAKYEIPVFTDYKKSILLNAFVEYIRSLLSMAEQKFSYESVFRYLRTGMTGFAAQEVDAIENYVLACGIKGYKAWQSGWTKETREAKGEELEALNHLRVRFVEQLDALMFVLKQRYKTVKDVTVSLYEFLVKQDCQLKLKEMELKFQEQGELALSKEYAQIYRIVIELFDKFVDLLGEERISLGEYCELLDAGLEEAKVGVIPPSLDQIVVGDLQRSRLTNIQVLFFMGANDTLLPGNLGQGGILSESDREKFEKNKITLSPGSKEKTYIQKFYLYMNLTKPKETLFLSYSKVSSDGKSLRPAYLVQEIKKMYPKLTLKDEEKRTLKEQELTMSSVREYVIQGMQKKEQGVSDAWKELYACYVRNHKEEKKKMLDATFYKKERELLTKEQVEALYQDMSRFSVTRLEQFASCAYAHFLNYGLALSNREEYEFAPVDLGNIVHQAMELYAQKLKEYGVSWIIEDEQLRTQIVDECVEMSMESYGNRVLYSSARNQYFITRIKNLVNRSVWAVAKQMEKGDFKPVGYEVKFRSGKIDRVDTCEDEDQIYVKIIDYKTGMKQFDLNSFYHGLQMQLLIYLNAALEIEKKRSFGKDVVPAGMFYYRMKDPLVDKTNDVEKAILKELRLDGLVNADAKVLEHLEHGLQGTSDYLPIGIKKDGSLSANSKAVMPEEFDEILQFAQMKEKQLAKGVVSGELRAYPYEIAGTTACDYCPYRDICGFDPQIEGCDYKKIRKHSTEEILEKIKEDLKKEQKEWE